MVERLGLVIYWIACVAAVAIALAGVVNLVVTMNPDGDLVRSIALAVIIYLIGRAARYALAGR